MSQQRVMSEIDSDMHILEQRLKIQVENGMQGVLDIAQDISQCCPEDAELKETARQMMLDYIEMEKEVHHQVTAMRQLKQMGEETATDPMRCLEERLAQLGAGGSTNPHSHPKYKEMESKMETTDDLISDEEFNSLRSTLLGFTQEEDVALTQTEVNTKCPYSGCMMVHPVRNKVCGHTYDRDPILSHIKSRNGRAKCPVGGCANRAPIDPKQLEEHSNLKKYIDFLNKRNNQAGSSGR